MSSRSHLLQDQARSIARISVWGLGGTSVGWLSLIYQFYLAGYPTASLFTGWAYGLVTVAYFAVCFYILAISLSLTARHNHDVSSTTFTNASTYVAIARVSLELALILTVVLWAIYTAWIPTHFGFDTVGNSQAIAIVPGLFSFLVFLAVGIYNRLGGGEVAPVSAATYAKISDRATRISTVAIWALVLSMFAWVANVLTISDVNNKTQYALVTLNYFGACTFVLSISFTLMARRDVDAESFATRQRKVNVLLTLSEYALKVGLITIFSEAGVLCNYTAEFQDSYYHSVAIGIIPGLFTFFVMVAVEIWNLVTPGGAGDEPQTVVQEIKAVVAGNGHDAPVAAQ